MNIHNKEMDGPPYTLHTEHCVIEDNFYYQYSVTNATFRNHIGNNSSLPSKKSKISWPIHVFIIYNYE